MAPLRSGIKVGFLIFLLVATQAWGVIRVVDPGGGADFTTLTDAYACTGFQPGDVLEITAGSYLVDTITPAASCSGLITQAVQGDSYTITGLESVETGSAPWTSVGSGVYSAVLKRDSDSATWSGTYPWIVYYEDTINPGVTKELRVIHDTDNDECTTALPEHHYVFDQGTQTLCVHLEAGTDPGTLTDMSVPWHTSAFDLTVNGPDNMTWRQNPADFAAQTGTGMDGFPAQFPHVPGATCHSTFFGFNGDAIKADSTSTGLTIDGLCFWDNLGAGVNQAGGTRTALRNKFLNSWYRRNGHAGIINLDDTSSSGLIADNLVEEIQNADFGACGSTARPCETGLDSDGAGILVSMDNGRVVRNYLRHIGGQFVLGGGPLTVGRRGRQRGIVVQDGGAALTVAYNYINRSSNKSDRVDPYHTPAAADLVHAIAVEALTNSKSYNGLHIHSNRMSDIDRAIVFDVPATVPSGETVKVTLNTIENWRDDAIQWLRGTPSKFAAVNIQGNAIATFSTTGGFLAMDLNDSTPRVEYNAFFCSGCENQIGGDIVRVGSSRFQIPSACSGSSCVGASVGGYRNNRWCNPKVERKGTRPRLFIFDAGSCAVDVVPASVATGVAVDVMGQPRVHANVADIGADEAQYGVVQGTPDPCTGESTDTKTHPILPAEVLDEIPTVTPPNPVVGDANDETSGDPGPIPESALDDDEDPEDIPEAATPVVVHQCPN